MTRRNPLRIVEEPPIDLYTEHRRHIMSRDWAAVHCEAEKRAPFASVLGRFR